MNKRVFVLRPQPGLEATLGAAARLGIDAAGLPLAEVCAVKWHPPNDDSFDALLIGSANAIRHGGDALARWRGHEAMVVGEATAAAAREAGLEVVATGSGGLQSLLDDCNFGVQPTRLLRLSGEKHVPLSPPSGVAIDTRVVYRVEYLELSDQQADSMRDGGIILLHSAEMARHFAKQFEQQSLRKERFAIAALAPRIAEAAGDGWRELGVSSTPTDKALLELVRNMCQ